MSQIVTALREVIAERERLQSELAAMRETADATVAANINLVNERDLARQQVDELMAEREVAVWKQQLDDTIIRAPFSGIVVAEILTADQHPNADKLRVCTVAAGPFSKDGPLQIVCGAPNARAGIKVPCALVGAELPPGDDGKPFQIKMGKLRGVESQGMLCSARELKLSDDHGGLLELTADAPIGQNIREHLQLDDAVFTLKLTPNLGHVLSVYGVARELAALTGAPLKPLAPVPVAARHDAAIGTGQSHMHRAQTQHIAAALIGEAQADALAGHRHAHELAQGRLPLKLLFEPGQTREVGLVALAGARTVYGFNARVMGKLR